jgi:hypothetical protein
MEVVLLDCQGSIYYRFLPFTNYESNISGRLVLFGSEYVCCHTLLLSSCLCTGMYVHLSLRSASPKWFLFFPALVNSVLILRVP